MSSIVPTTSIPLCKETLSSKDFFTRQTFFDLMQEQFDKHLPYMIAVTENREGDFLPYDARNLYPIYQQCHVDPLSSIPIQALYHYIIHPPLNLKQLASVKEPPFQEEAPFIQIHPFIEPLGMYDESNPKQSIFVQKFLELPSIPKTEEKALSGQIFKIAYLFAERNSSKINATIMARYFFLAGRYGSHPFAIYNLSRCYATGIGLPQEPDSAKRLLELSASLGFPRAIQDLGLDRK